MASLSLHLQRLEDHGRLAFHPECPICRRERLTGVLTSEGVVTRRAKAALVAGLLAAPFGGDFAKATAVMTCFAALSILAMALGRETRGDILPH